MKNVFSNILFLLVFNFAFGQIEWVGNHEFSEAAQGILKTSSGQYVLLHGNAGGLTVFDSDGSMALNDTIIQYSDYGLSDIIETNDSSIIYVLGGLDCDVSIYFINKYDKDWNLVWWSYSSGAGPIAQLSDQSTVIGGVWNYSLERWSADGNPLWEVSLYPNLIKDIAVANGDNILVATDNGLFEYNANGTLTDSSPNFQVDRLEILPNGNFLAQTSDNLFLFSPDFNQLNMVFSQGDSITDIDVKGNEIGVLTAAPKILRYDLGLNPIGTVPLTGQNQTFTSLDFDGNGFVVAGGEKYGEDVHQNTSAFIKQFGLDGSTGNTNTDAELTAVSQSGQIGVTDYFGIYEIKIPNIDLLVTNNGTETVHSITANIKVGDILNVVECSIIQQFSKVFDNLDLQPGASVHLIWDEVKFGTFDYFAGQQLELCFWTSLPNNHLETNNDNDVACKEVTVAAYEQFPVEFHHKFHHNFNPAEDLLYLEMQSVIDLTSAKAHIFNAAGQLVHTEALKEQRLTLQLNGLADGVYFLQILSGERAGWGKFVKY